MDFRKMTLEEVHIYFSKIATMAATHAEWEKKFSKEFVSDETKLRKEQTRKNLCSIQRMMKKGGLTQRRLKKIKEMHKRYSLDDIVDKFFSFINKEKIVEQGIERERE